MVKVLVVASARDGSTTIRELVHGFFEANGQPIDAGYVTDTPVLWPAIIDYVRTGDPASVVEILAKWRHSVEISHGMSFILPIVRAVFGPSVKIVRVRRERASHVESLAKRTHINPGHWGGYSATDATPEIPRPTAVDYDEMSMDEWAAKPTKERFEWFLSKQDELFDRHAFLFKSQMVVETESLSNKSTIRKLAKFMDPRWTAIPAPVHVHATTGIEVSDLPDEKLREVEAVMEQFDQARALTDKSYAVNFFLEALLSDRNENRETLSTSVDSLSARIKDWQSAQKNAANRKKPRKRKASTRKN